MITFIIKIIYFLWLYIEKTCEKGYVTILGTGTNSDGFTKEGITFPSKERQINLMKNVISTYNIDINDIEYIEAHGTGTVAGDGVEISALNEVYGSDERQIMIGSVKSNMGHAEGASGIMSMIKLMLCYEHGLLVPNLHFNTSVHTPILSGRFKVVTELQPWKRGYTCISNFGFGGSSTHVVLGCGPYLFQKREEESFFVYGQTENMKVNIPHTYKNISMYKYRGIVSHGQLIKSNCPTSKHICWVFSGQGSNWLNMGKGLIDHPPFVSLLQRLGNVIDMDLHVLFRDGSKMFDKTVSTICICAIQIFLVTYLKSLRQDFDFVIGHSMGEICASYADGAMTEDQTIRIAKFRSDLCTKMPNDGFLIRIEKQKDEIFKSYVSVAETSTERVYHIPREDGSKYTNFDLIDVRGTMVVVGESSDFVQRFLRMFPMCVIACYNSPMGLTLSGPLSQIQEIVCNIQKEKPETFVCFLNTDGIAFHSPTMSYFQDFITESITQILSSSIKPFSDKWLSTSSENPLCDANYHTDNIVLPVRFCDAIRKLPQNTLVLEVGPSASLLTQIKRTRNDLILLPTMERNKSELQCLDTIKSNLWLNNFLEKNDHNDFHFPLEDRHHDSWDHDTQHMIPSYEALLQKLNDSKTQFVFNMSNIIIYFLVWSTMRYTIFDKNLGVVHKHL